jgi:hypothetical protein
VEFDLAKVELIHFFINKRTIPKRGILINNQEIAPKSLVRWLGIYFDTRLTFTEHIRIKVTNAERAYYRPKGLSNI